ncbi:MAG: hypothetical protein K8T26_07330 [Lentisphaerae bacterium]|nr:hypothetical protein [Lentisphaerota bacterium]
MATLAREKIPAHLPDKLAISLWLWNWLTDTGPGESFHDIEKSFKDLVDRGFNAIRIDAMLGWIYDAQFRRRGPVEIGRIAEPGYANYGPGLTTKGGVFVDVHERIVELFRLARTYDVYVALTTWQYQEGHSTTLIKDSAIRKELYDVPLNERLMFVARQYEALLNDLKKEGLTDRIAYLEIHNEVDYVKVCERPDQLRALMESAMAYLQERFPEILICSDRNSGARDRYGFDYEKARRFTEEFAANDQLIDHHLYAFGVQGELFDKAGLFFPAGDNDEIDDKMNDLEKNNRFLRQLLKAGYEPWDSFKNHFEYKSVWRKLMYFYENLDIDKYDHWMFMNYPSHEPLMKNYWRNSIQHLHDYARQRNLPLVCDEGYIFWPPIHSQFEVSAVGKDFHEFIVDQMIKHEYWGIMVCTYAAPGLPLWEKEADFLRKINRRILTT